MSLFLNLFGDIFLGFQSQGGSHCLCAFLLVCFLPVCNGFIRLSSVVTLADLLVTSVVAGTFLIYVPEHVQALVGLESGIEHEAASQTLTLKPPKK